jgi:hypothetical protein
MHTQPSRIRALPRRPHVAAGPRWGPVWLASSGGCSSHQQHATQPSPWAWPPQAREVPPNTQQTRVGKDQLSSQGSAASSTTPPLQTLGMLSKGRTTIVPQENGVMGAMPLNPITPLLRQNLGWGGGETIAACVAPSEHTQAHARRHGVRAAPVHKGLHLVV